MELDVRRPKLKKTTSYLRQRASQLDSFDGEVEGDEAEFFPAWICSGRPLAAAMHGGELGYGAAMAARVRVLGERGSEGTSEGRERAGPGGLVLSTRERGAPAVERGGGEGGVAWQHGNSAAVATVSMTLLRKPPCTVFLFLIFFFSFKNSTQNHSIEGLKHFYKIWKIYIASILF